MTIKLSQSTLDQLPDEVAIPTYDRSKLTPGIVHIGVGNFHRAHQAIYLDKLFALGEDHDWALIGAGVRPHDAALRADLNKQDWLTTVVDLDPGGLTARICGSMIDYTEIDPAALIETLTQQEIRIVSLTVTEGGYFVDAKTGGFDASHPDIQADVANPDAPQTVFGILCAALRKRRDAGVDLFTVLSCDNLPENGHVAREATCGLAAAIDRGLWSLDESQCRVPQRHGRLHHARQHPTANGLWFRKDSISKMPARSSANPFANGCLEDNFPPGAPPWKESASSSLRMWHLTN